jgi:hypothetical protein
MSIHASTRSRSGHSGDQRQPPHHPERGKLLGLYAPPKRRIDVITHDALMEAIADLEADIARKKAQLTSHKLRDAALEAGDLG